MNDAQTAFYESESMVTKKKNYNGWQAARREVPILNSGRFNFNGHKQQQAINKGRDWPALCASLTRAWLVKLVGPATQYILLYLQRSRLAWLR